MLREAIDRVPALKYAWGVFVAFVLLAIVGALKVDLKTAVFSVPILVLFLILLFLFSRIAALPAKALGPQLQVFTWVALAAFVFVTGFLGTSAFFNWPLHFGLGGPTPSLIIAPSFQAPSSVVRPTKDSKELRVRVTYDHPDIPRDVQLYCQIAKDAQFSSPLLKDEEIAYPYPSDDSSLIAFQDPLQSSVWVRLAVRDKDKKLVSTNEPQMLSVP